MTYKTEDGFEFQVPISDAGMGTFLAEDKAIFFMRWIRKQLELVKEWKSEQELEDEVMFQPSEPMSAASVQTFNSIIRVRIPEENILRFTEEDLEDQP